MDLKEHSKAYSQVLISVKFGHRNIVMRWQFGRLNPTPKIYHIVAFYTAIENATINTRLSLLDQEKESHLKGKQLVTLHSSLYIKERIPKGNSLLKFLILIIIMNHLPL
jgi:hypothetical protein